ncbi:MAG: hypothetical protein GY765_13115 [bacterium]|nr:hypothetical protein [bacterium]
MYDVYGHRWSGEERRGSGETDPDEVDGFRGPGETHREEGEGLLGLGEADHKEVDELRWPGEAGNGKVEQCHWPGEAGNCEVEEFRGKEPRHPFATYILTPTVPVFDRFRL